MTRTDELSTRVLAVLLEAVGADSASAFLVPCEKGSYRGFLAFGADRAWFVRDRFGRLEYETAFAFADVEAVERREGFMGQELRVTLAGQTVRFTRLSVLDANEAEGRFVGGKRAEIMASAPVVENPEPQGPPGAPPPESGAPAAGAGEGVRPLPSAAQGKSPAATRFSSRAMPPRTAAAPAPAPEPEDDPDGRAGLVRVLSATEPRSAAGTDLLRQLASIAGPAPTPAAAADVLLAHASALARGETGELERNPFGLKILGPAAVALEAPRVPRRVRILAARAMGALRARRSIGFLVYHAGREGDPDVARAIFEALAATGGEAAQRCLLKVAAESRPPLDALAVAVLRETPWIPSVRILAELARSEEPGLAAAAGEAAAHVLRLPPPSEEIPPDEPGPWAEVFGDFWKRHGHGSPLDLLKASVEANLQAVQSSTRARAVAAEENLDALTAGADEVRAQDRGHAGGRALAWILWWARNKGRPPKDWARRPIADALGLPVPGIPGAAPPRAPARARPAPGPRAVRVKTKQAAGRAAVAGIISAVAHWLVFFELPARASLPPFAHPVLAWAAFAAAGGLALARPGRAAALALFGAAGGLFVHLMFLTEVPFLTGAAVALGWAFIGAGAFRVRRSSVHFLFGGALGLGLNLVFHWVFGGFLELFYEVPYVATGIFAAVFWFVQYLPETKDEGSGTGGAPPAPV